MAPKVKNPCINSDVVCPICGKTDTYYRLKPHIFNEANRDVDMRPRKYVWRQDGFENYYPPFYYMWYCKNCHFTAGHQFFKDPIKNTSFSLNKFQKGLQEAYKNNPKVQNVSKLLTEGFNSDNMDYLQVIKLHYLAIFQLQQFEQFEKIDSLNLARYCMRLAWLLRDISDDESKEEIFGDKIHKLVKQLQKKWPKVYKDESSALEAAVEYYKTALGRSRAIESANHEVMMFSLLTRIYLQQGKVPQARQYIMSCRDKLQKFESKCDQACSSETLSEDLIQEMYSDARRMRTVVEEVQDLFEDMRKEWEKKEKKKAKTIIEKLKINPETTDAEELRSSLIKHGIDKTVAMKLYPDRKKKFMGLF